MKFVLYILIPFFLVAQTRVAPDQVPFTYADGGIGALVFDCTSPRPCSVDVTAVVPLKAGANTWTGLNDFSRAVKTAPFQSGTVDPPTCDPALPEFFVNTATKRLKYCLALNVWSAGTPLL